MSFLFYFLEISSLFRKELAAAATAWVACVGDSRMRTSGTAPDLSYLTAYQL
jgi:hypothetical protein